MKIELNITLACNMSCTCCDRMCDIYKDRTEHMSLDQIDKFIRHSKGRIIERIKILGGEPLLHPQFVEIYNKLHFAFKGVRTTRLIKAESNHILPIPDVIQTPSMLIAGVPLEEKMHLPYLWHPKDLGYDIGAQTGCRHLNRCGTSLDKYGYLPCSSAIMISRLFGLTDLYRDYLPSKPWGLDRLCQHCIFAMPKRWRAKHSKYLKDFTKEERTPTKRFKEAMDKFDHNEFYKTQKEF